MIIQESLKKDTRADHERLEEIMFVRSIMTGSLSLAEYKQILTSNYIIHKAFENLLFTALPHAMADQIQSLRRYKLPSLLIALEEAKMISPTRMIKYQDNIAYSEAPAVLGALYVLEGATLGGHVILKRLVINPHVNYLGLGFHYYRVYGDELIDKWKSFCALLNQQPEADYPAILTGARRMFTTIASTHSTKATIL